MNPRERLLAVFSGKTPDKVPFAPFSELVPRSSSELELRKKGMGLVVHHSSVEAVRLGVERSETTEPLGKRVILETEKGTLSEFFQYKKGASNDSMIQQEYLIKESRDYETAIAMIDSTECVMDESDDAVMEHRVSSDGILHAWASEPPYMEAQYYLGFEKWVYDQMDEQEQFSDLLNALGRLQERRMALVAKASQKMVNIGNLAGNFSPAAFVKHMLPYFRKYGDMLKKAGKQPTIHADASNLKQFKDLIPQTGVKIIEAFTPPPIGDLSLAEARVAWGEDTTIWIHFPETVLREGYDQTFAYTKELLQSDPCPNKLIGITEMGFVGANKNDTLVMEAGMHAILDAIDAFGRYQ